MSKRLLALPVGSSYLLKLQGPVQAGIKLTSEQVAKLEHDDIPSELADAIIQAWGLVVTPRNIHQLLTVRMPTTSILKLSWEINDFCNFSCPFCFLGEKLHSISIEI